MVKHRAPTRGMWAITFGVGLLALALSVTGCESHTPSVQDYAGGGAPPPATPAPTSGPLSKASLPSPKALGRGWSYRVDAGSIEDGYAGNGTPAMARDPQDAARSVLPFGCRPQKVPTPTHALEVSYTYDGTTQAQRPGVALAMLFKSQQHAKAFYSTHVANLRSCAKRHDAPLMIRAQEPADKFVYQRHERHSLPWNEAIKLRNNQVMFVALATT